jgi:uncharacterized protein YjlB
MALHTLSGKTIHHLIEDDGTFPNNGRLPLLAYQGVLDLPAGDPARGAEELFDAHNWEGSWRNGIFSYHHYHSTAHEVLGVYGGKARVQLGGPEGPKFEVRRGDVIVIPAGVAHKNLGSSLDFRVVGAYPAGQRPDMNYGKTNERPQADSNIAKVGLPKLDPVFGDTGPLIGLWHN